MSALPYSEGALLAAASKAYAVGDWREGSRLRARLALLLLLGESELRRWDAQRRAA